MKNELLPQLSMEAISYQGRSLLLFDLTALIDNARAAGGISDQASLDRLNLSKIIFDRTGISTNIYLTDSQLGDMGITLPVFDSQNPLHRLKLEGKFGAPAYEHFQRALRLNDTLSGTIDLKKSRVSGVFSALKCELFVPAEGFHPNSRVTSEEMAAGLIHELGHAYSAMEAVFHQVRTNAVVTTAIEALRVEQDEKRQVQLVGQALNALQINEKELISSILSASSEKEQFFVLVRAADKARADYLDQLSDGYTSYTYRAIEYLADQFTVRHGAAVPLTSFLDKIGHQISAGYGQSRTAFLASQITRYTLLAGVFTLSGVAMTASAVGVAVVVGIGVALSALVSLAGASMNDRIQSPSERIGRVKQDLVQLLKNPKLNAKRRQEVLNDLEVVEKLLATIKEHSGLADYLWRTLPGLGRKAAKTREFQKGLEDLINNDLFAAAARLSSLTR